MNQKYGFQKGALLKNLGFHERAREIYETMQMLS